MLVNQETGEGKIVWDHEAENMALAPKPQNPDFEGCVESVCFRGKPMDKKDLPPSTMPEDEKTDLGFSKKMRPHRSMDALPAMG